MTPNFSERIELYLKPTNVSPCWLFLIVTMDMFLSVAFVACQFAYILTDDFTKTSDKVMQVIIGFGITGGVLFYSFLDASRFISHILDKILYLFSCLLMKPIYLPILLPGSCFRSPLSNKAQYQDCYQTKVSGVKETEFVRAVQETNFLFSFTLASFSAMGTMFTILREDSYTTIDRVMIAIASVYGISGSIICVLVYGRKLPKNFMPVQDN